MVPNVLAAAATAGVVLTGAVVLGAVPLPDAGTAFVRAGATSSLSARTATTSDWRCEGGRPTLYVRGAVNLRNTAEAPADGQRLTVVVEERLPGSQWAPTARGDLEIAPLSAGDSATYLLELPISGWKQAAVYRVATTLSEEAGAPILETGWTELGIAPPVDFCAVPCTLGVAYWANHAPGAAPWPVPSLTLGTSSYEARTAHRILLAETRDDAGLALARQLIAAKLNVAAGAAPTPVAEAISAADALLGAQTLSARRSGLAPSPKTTPLTRALEDFNLGRSGPPPCA